MTHAEKWIWTEKYRPTKIQELILPDRIIEQLEKGPYQNFLFYGSQGVGKTSTARVLAKNHPTLEINCSLESSVDNVRGKITDFAQTLSIMDDEKKSKIIILDELEGVSEQYLKALRGTIEKFHKTTKFIATTNYINKIPEPIQSRFECINYDFSDREEKQLLAKYIRRTKEIVELEKMTIENKALIELVTRKFPDMRSIITSLYAYYNQGKMNITIDDIKTYYGIHKDIYELIFSDSKPTENYKYLVSNYSNKVDDVIKSLGSEFFEYIQLEKPEAMRYIGGIAYEINKHSYELNFVIDPVVTMLSLVLRLQAIVKGA